jgi:ATP-dependent DNA helicase RecG
VLLLDRVQKGQALRAEEAKTLKGLQLIEGRSPRYFISAKVADAAGQKARYIHNRGLDDGFYRKLIEDYLRKYGRATRQDLDNLILPKLPDVLDADQKQNKLRNLLQAMRRAELIQRDGTRAAPIWRPGHRSGIANRRTDSNA